MSAEKKQDDLNAFEAALAALAPRTDRLDRDRLMFLAGQQSILPSPDQLSVGARRETEGEGGARRKRAWLWPAVFTAMSAVAAVLLAMVVYKPSPQVVERTVEPAASESGLASDANQSRRNRIDVNLALLSEIENRKFNEAISPYANSVLLQQCLTKGMDSWKPRNSGSDDTQSISTQPMTNRELMDQYLKNFGADPS
jgi:hypothetical protein